MGINLDVLSGEDPPERPRVKPELPPPVIPFSAFVEAQEDPKVAAFLQEAKTESDELKAAGLIHPGG
jgi:hypothetical protein